jgi:ferredoxin-type protein NapH
LTKIKIARIVTTSLAIVVISSGVIGELRYQGICTLGAYKIWGTCPLGFLERSLALRELLPQWPYALLTVVVVILLGRVFCAWVCPTVLLRRVFKVKGELKPKPEASPSGIKWSSYSSYAFLGGVLLASYVFRFPIFCLFCPIGLFFGFLYAVGSYLSVDTLSLELVLFPAMLVLELWLLKSWCRSICPVGALLSIIGSFNRFLLPVVGKDKCLTSTGVNCQACKRACPEGIDLSKTSRGLAPNSCTKCLECYEKCPAKAIKVAVFK